MLTLFVQVASKDYEKPLEGEVSSKYCETTLQSVKIHLYCTHIRLREMANGFDHFKKLNNTHLGSVVEFGAGGYTQTRNIFEV